MKKSIYLILLLIGFTLSGNAQSLSISDLWNYIGQSSNLKVKKLNKEVQAAQLNVRRSERFPVIYGDANLQRNLIIPTTPVPAIAFDPNAEEGAILPLKFSTKWNSKAGLQLEWNLFDPNRKSQQQEDLIVLEKAKVEESLAEQDWKINSTLAYASIVLATEQYQFALKDSALFEEINNINKERFLAGRGSSEDYSLSQQEVQRKKILMHESWSILKEANLELGRYYPLDSIRVLSNNMEEILMELGAFEKKIYDQQLVELDQQLSMVQLKGIKRQVLPSLSFNAYYGAQYFSNSFNIIDKSNWYGYSYANLGLRIPISAYFSNSSAIKKAELSEKVYIQQLEDLQLNDEIDKKQNQEKIIFSKQKIESLNRIKDLALQNKEEKLAAYQAGRILLIDFNKANSDYLKSCQDIWQAKYDLLKIILEQ